MKKPTLIIAEAGVNHNGDIQLAKSLIDIAKESGADFIKFQLFNSSRLTTKSSVKADYQSKNTDATESQQAMLKKLELSDEQYLELMTYSKNIGIEIFATGFDIQSVNFLANTGQKLFKIPSGEINNTPYLRQIAQYNVDVILSTGMSTMADIENAINTLVNAGTDREKITVLHCTTEYPTPMSEVNLNAMQSIKMAFNVKVGYSDHTEGIEIPIAAVALGATVIEKHFTQDRNLPGPDHKASLEPNELKCMVSAIRNIEVALGDGVKKVTTSEYKNIAVARKSIVAKSNINKGDILSIENLTTKRPGTGIPPTMWDYVIGKPANKSYAEDDLIEL